MIEVTKKAQKEILEKLSIQEKNIEFLGGGREDSDGIVYSYQSNGKKMVLKILAFKADEEHAIDDLKVRVQYANFLGEHGIKLAYPEVNKNGNLYESSLDNNHIYTAYCMEFFEGGFPESNELNDNLVRNWGKLTGKSHKLTGDFVLSEATDENFGYQGEVSFFIEWCKELDVKKTWSDMSKTLLDLPRDKSEYGFIHNDNHQRNIIVSKDDLTLIDFDCARRQFFIQDIITPAQGIMFDITGGMMSDITDEKRLKQFFDAFLSGYEQEYHLTDFWYDKISLFINYRRMLLFTCMQNWLNTEPELKNNFIRMIQNPPKIL